MIRISASRFTAAAGRLLVALLLVCASLTGTNSFGQSTNRCDESERNRLLVAEEKTFSLVKPELAEFI